MSLTTRKVMGSKMTSRNGKFKELSPEEKLASPEWRKKQRWWIYFSLWSLGILGWLSFVIARIRTRRDSGWLGMGIIFLIPALVFVVWTPGGLFGNILAFFNWLVPAVVAWGSNDRYLVELAYRGQEIPQKYLDEWEAGNKKESSDSQQPGHLEVAPAKEVHPTRNLSDARLEDFFGSSAAATVVGTDVPVSKSQGSDNVPTHREEPKRDPRVDINTSSSEAIAAFTGVPEALAKRIVAIRDVRGPYRGLEDLTQAANLQPHELLRLRDRLIFSQPIQSDPNPNPNRLGGRVLDI